MWTYVPLCTSLTASYRLVSISNLREKSLKIRRATSTRVSREYNGEDKGFKGSKQTPILPKAATWHGQKSFTRLLYGVADEAFILDQHT